MTADASIPDGDKKQLIDELNEAIKSTPRLEHLENVELVKVAPGRNRKGAAVVLYGRRRGDEDN